MLVCPFAAVVAGRNQGGDAGGHRSACLIVYDFEAYARTEGHPDFHTWVGTENYEMRVAPDLTWIDQKILDVVQRGGA